MLSTLLNSKKYINTMAEKNTKNGKINSILWSFWETIFGTDYTRKKTQKLLRYNISLNSNYKAPTAFKSGTGSNSKHTITLTPLWYNNISLFFKEKVFIEKKTKNASGSYSYIYLEYYDENNKKKNKKTDIIFKLTEYNNDELFGLYFNAFLYKYNEFNNPEKVKYLCRLEEFGEVQLNRREKKYYAYMKNCGEPLKNINKIKIQKYQLTELIKNIFTQCLESLKLIHYQNYLHLDIKPANFLYSIQNNDLNTLQIKIIDFGFTKQNKYNTKVNYFGTSDTIPCDWLKNYVEGKNTILEKHHDLFELGCTFLRLIFSIINKIEHKISIPAIICPIMELNRPNFIIIRANYSEAQHNSNMNTIKKHLIDLGMNEKDSVLIRSILYGMCNPEPRERFENCDFVLGIVEKINIQNNSQLLSSTKVIKPRQSPPPPKKELIPFRLPNKQQVPDVATQTAIPNKQQVPDVATQTAISNKKRSRPSPPPPNTPPPSNQFSHT